MKKETILFIDAGHGGIEPKTKEYTTPPSYGKKFYHEGASFHNGGWFYEGVSNRRFAYNFMSQATSAGFMCVPVFHPYKDTELNTRTKLANNTEMLLEANSLYLSFHSNAANTKARGLYLFHHPNSSGSKAICNEIIGPLQEVTNAFGVPDKNRAVREGYGYKRDKNGKLYKYIFHVLGATNMKSILLETLFFDNREDAEILNMGHFIHQYNSVLVDKLKIILP